MTAPEPQNIPMAIPVEPQHIPQAIPVKPGKAPAEMDALTVVALVCTVGSAACLLLPFLWLASVPLGACGIVLGFTAGHYAAKKGREASRVIFWCILLSFLAGGFALLSLQVLKDEVKSINKQLQDLDS